MRAASFTRGSATSLPSESARSISGAAFHSLRKGAERRTRRARAQVASDAIRSTSADDARARHAGSSASRAATIERRIACLASRSWAPTGASLESIGITGF